MISSISFVAKTKNKIFRISEMINWSGVLKSGDFRKKIVFDCRAHLAELCIDRISNYVYFDLDYFASYHT